MRRHDWQGRLSRFLGGLDRQTVEWDRFDCLTGLAAGAVEVITGEDIFAAAKGRYSTERGALRVLRSEGFESLADVVGSVLPEISPSRATRGDIAAIPDDSPFGFGLGVVDNARIHVLTDQGRGTVPRSQMTRAFKV